jgi:outer membrane protein OmpA-like peptidoglycan-associated protein
VRVPRDSLLSLSYTAPTACNDSDLGMAKNRRVEVWVSK